MPYALLSETILEPSFAPLLPAPALEGTHFDFQIWESIFQINGGTEPFESAFVVEGLRGLYLTKDEADHRGLKDGQTVHCFIATYLSPPGESPPSPDRKLWVQLKLHVHSLPVIDTPDFTEGLSEFLSSPPVIGLCDVLELFDISHDGLIIQAGEDGHLGLSEKQKLTSLDLLIVRKESSPRQCIEV